MMECICCRMNHTRLLPLSLHSRAFFLRRKICLPHCVTLFRLWARNARIRSAFCERFSALVALTTFTNLYIHKASSIMGNKTTDQQFKKTHQVVGANGNDLVDDLNGKIMKEAPGHEGVSWTTIPFLSSFLSLHLLLTAFLFTLHGRYRRTWQRNRQVNNAHTTNKSNEISLPRVTPLVRQMKKLSWMLTSRRSSTSAVTMLSRNIQSIDIHFKTSSRAVMLVIVCAILQDT